MNTVVQLRPSTSEKPTVSPRKGKKNLDYRSQEYLDEAQIERLVVTAGNGRNPERDRLLILMGFRHALRVSGLVGLRWQQISLDKATIHINRAKNGIAGQHGLTGEESRLLRALRRKHPYADFVFLSERKAPLSIDGAQKLIERLGKAAKLPFPIHAHMLRHSARQREQTGIRRRHVACSTCDRTAEPCRPCPNQGQECPAQGPHAGASVNETRREARTMRLLGR